MKHHCVPQGEVGVPPPAGITTGTLLVYMCAYIVCVAYVAYMTCKRVRTCTCA